MFECIRSQIFFSTKALRIALGWPLLILLGACTTFEYHETKIVEVNRVDEAQELELNEDELLDVGIVVFDPGVDILDEESAAYSSVRQSEAVWFSSQLKSTLDYSNAWGLVRTLPNENTIIDVVVKGKLIESNGEVVSLLVTVADASGVEWFSKEYFQRASSYAYNPEVNLPDDPFQAMFNEVSNDLFDYRAALKSEQLLAIRSIARVRFARDFVPQAFSDYLLTDDDGNFQLQRIPADSDPVMQRVDRIRARNDLFLDVVQDYYRAFNKNMAEPYKEWRKISYKEVVYERQLKEQARKEKIAGVAVMVGGLATATGARSNASRAAGHIGIFSGARIFRGAFQKQNEASIHSETLREMGASLEAELEPSIIDLQDRSVTLSGTVEDQFEEWRRILGRMFDLEQGTAIEDSSPEPNSPETANRSPSIKGSTSVLDKAERAKGTDKNSE